MTRILRLARRFGPPALAVALLWLVLRSVSLPIIWQTLAERAGSLASNDGAAVVDLAV